GQHQLVLVHDLQRHGPRDRDVAVEVVSVVGLHDPILADRHRPRLGDVLDMLLGPLVREVVYPRHGTRVAPDPSMHELVVDGAVLRGWVVNPDRDRVLLYFGGNGERLDLWQEVVAQRFPGHTTYLMAYRGYGAS